MNKKIAAKKVTAKKIARKAVPRNHQTTTTISFKVVLTESGGSLKKPRINTVEGEISAEELRSMIGGALFG